MPETSTQSTVPAAPARRRRIWRWFAAGFLGAFVGMLIFYPMLFYNGRVLYETVLWRYYVLEFKQQMQSSGALGPTSGGMTALATVAVEHLVAAAVAGILLAVVGRWWPSRRAA